MPLKLVEVKKTPLTKEDFVEATVFAWYSLWKEIPNKQSVGIFLAQTWIETAGRALYGYNVGNSKVPNKIPEDKDIYYHMLPNTWEIINGKKTFFNPPHRQTWFQAFTSLQEGIQHHLNFIKNGRYANAWAAVKIGNVKEYATQLKNKGYYTAPVEDYIKGMNLFYSPYMKSKMYENSVRRLNEAILAASQPKPHPQEEGKSEPIEVATDPVLDTPDDLVKDVKQYIQVSKKKHTNWWDGIAQAVSKVFASFTKK